MKIYNLQLGVLKANCYIAETEPGRCIAVDIGGESELLLNFIKEKNLKLEKILLTHGHFDHISGVADVSSVTGAEVYIHEEDACMLESPELSLSTAVSQNTFKPIKDYTVVFGDCYINDGDYTFRVLHTPGHSRGSVCYVCDNVIFSGDTLFCESIGRTDFPGSSSLDMKASLRKICALKGDYRIYPGHNASTTLDYERISNPYMPKP